MVPKTIPRTKAEAWIQWPSQRKRKKPYVKDPEEDASSRRKRKGKSYLADDTTDADDPWQESSWDDWSSDCSEESYAAKGKGKKGKKGKGKSKYGKDGKDGKSGSKDGAAQLADVAQSSTPTIAATTFFVDHSNSYNLSFMATERHEAFITQPLTPTSMVLDSGCTRAMTSRVAAQDLMKFGDQNKDCGIWYTTAEITSQFTFANSESTNNSRG